MNAREKMMKTPTQQTPTCIGWVKLSLHQIQGWFRMSSRVMGAKGIVFSHDLTSEAEVNFEFLCIIAL